MSASRNLQIQPAGATGPLSPDQQKFNTLIRQIEQGRASLQAWKDATLQFSQSHGQLIVPLEAELDATRRAWVLAMDAASLRKGWTKGEAAVWSDLVSEAAGPLLELSDGDDAELKAIYERHAQVDFEEQQQESLEMMKLISASMSGVDPGEVEDVTNEAELFERLHQKMRERAAAAPDQGEAPPRRRKTPAQKRREAEGHEASLSVREVYRKLASALHPDREPDATARAAKTALMQQANQAYANEDLLTLLELQLRAEQIDAGSIANMDAGRLKHYILVLKDQAAELKREIQSVQMDFSMTFGPRIGGSAKPETLGRLLHGQAQSLRVEVSRLKHEMRRLDDKDATKRWLKTERQRMRDDPMGGGYF